MFKFYNLVLIKTGIILLACESAIAQYRERGRYYHEDNIDLPRLDQTAFALLAAVVFCLIGIGILKGNKNKNSNTASVLTGVFIVLAGICALPTVAWLLSLLSFVVGAVFLILIVLVIIGAIWDVLKKKS
jgi:ABC-type multidrug transport system permease subunit